MSYPSTAGPNLSRLGLPGQAVYYPDFKQAPEPTVATYRKAPMISLNRPGVPELAPAGTSPSEQQRAGAVINGLVISLNQLDHFARQADALGFIKHNAKRLLRQLVQLSDNMLEQYSKNFATAVGDRANVEGTLLGQMAELFLQLTPRQKRSSLLHMHNMAGTTYDYVPKPEAPKGPMPLPTDLRRVVVETPYAGDIEENLRYLRACLRDCLLRGEAPIASHALYTQPGVLNDNLYEERDLGMEAGLSWAELAEATVVYTDRGTSPGMRAAIVRAENEGRPVEYRQLDGWVSVAPEAALAA